MDLRVLPERAPAASLGVLEHLFAAHHVVVWRAARRCGLTADLAATVTEDTFRLAARHLETIAPSDHRSFLVGTALALARVRLRGTAARPMRYVERIRDIDTQQLDEIDLVDLALARLEPDLVDVLVLFDVERLPFREIQAALRIPPSALEQRLGRAREQFRMAVRDLVATTFPLVGRGATSQGIGPTHVR